MLKSRIAVIFCLCLIQTLALAYINRTDVRKPIKKHTLQPRMEECTPANAEIDQEINNVRARLLAGGDVWWDLSNGKYVVPKTLPGQREVSSIFAGAVWLGGLDPSGNLKIAAVDYRTGGSTDYYTGPIDPGTGATDSEICNDWDRFFTVYNSEVEPFDVAFKQSQQTGEPMNCDSIPDGVKFWPAKGNPNFLEKFEFELPNTGQGLASFWDEDGDGDYDPCKGDFPTIDIRGCAPINREAALELVPDEMIFWIYNDAGGPHTKTNGAPILMEVQVQAFGYTSNDEINDMTFQRYKLINRASSDIQNCYFAMWIDPDLGCSEDDYIGCNIDRSLAFVYNEDALDGDNGVSCSTGVGTYQDEIPVLGVDYFRGPLAPFKLDPLQGEPMVLKGSDAFPFEYNVGDTVLVSPVGLGESFEFSLELGMSSFVYYNRGGGGHPPATTDPGTDVQFYNYLQGLWLDGTPLTEGDDGYNPGSLDVTRYALPDDPNDDDGWSMCSANLAFGDRRILQASGPFLLKPQAINELIVGVVWVPDMNYPCPDLSRLYFADELAQSLFDNCFNIKDGPDAPDVDIVELDRELILLLSNDSIASNNKFESYAEPDLNFVPDTADENYYFEGYEIYQLENANVTSQELGDIDKARLIAQVDINNGVKTLFNWKPSLEDPTGSDDRIVWTFEKKVEGADQGLRKSFQITEDAFADGDTRLINHKQYYYLAIAYAYNGWAEFNPREDFGQRSPYCAGRRNIKVYTGVPRPIIFTNQNANFGDEALVTRVSGVGAGSNFLDMTSDMYDKILDGSADGRVSYKSGNAPFEVKIVNPLEVVESTFRLTIDGDFDESNCEYKSGATWILEDLQSGAIFKSESSIDALNEQILGEYGFSIAIGQTNDVGDIFDDANGTIGFAIQYADDTSTPWLGLINENVVPLSNFLKTGTGEDDQPLDPDEVFSTFGGFVPFILADNSADGNLSPGWKDNNNSSNRLSSLTEIADLNNVDIVLTSDKSKWSRCVIVESSINEARSGGFESEGNTRQFDTRRVPSVGKEAGADGNPLPDGDGEGMGWFPGYAVDVETGKRLNIFFGENSMYGGDLSENLQNGVGLGRDMMFNPSSEVVNLDISGAQGPWNVIAGGQHYIYVTKTEYDSCALFRELLDPSKFFIFKRNALKHVTWAGIPMLPPGLEMLSYADGLIPADLTIKIRVDNPFGQEEVFDENSNNTTCDVVDEPPVYEFEFEGSVPTELTQEQLENALSSVNVVPNPYYAYSAYETSRLENEVRITNLPNQCTVTIYSLDGKFIRQFKRDEQGRNVGGANRAIRSTQANPDIRWDLKNSRGIPVSSGVYLIHVQDPVLNLERTIKWFGVNRKFDPAGL